MSTGIDDDTDWRSERGEWHDALDNVLKERGEKYVVNLLRDLQQYVSRRGLVVTEAALNTPYRNTIALADEPEYPGDIALEQRIENLIRWNAVAMVQKAEDAGGGVGGHIATYLSAATAMEVGFNHIFRGPGFLQGSAGEEGEDLVSFQAHAAPGVYARAFLEGRLSERQLTNFRRETGAGGGLSSYPHPRRMPEFWQMPCASMGLSTPLSIYIARFARYLEHRGMKVPSQGKIWNFIGDGESDEPEVLGTINIAARERLDNLVLIINCNLQRLDGPVRGNGKIIQELERSFRGADWHVIKVIWGGGWDPILARDTDGILQQRMEQAVDGDYQYYTASGGDRVREHWVENTPALRELMKTLTDEEIRTIKRGGHDHRKVYAAFRAAREVTGKPIVVLLKTVKGDGLGPRTEGRNTVHQKKILNIEERVALAQRLDIPLSRAAIERADFYKPETDSPEIKYLLARRAALGGALPARRARFPKLLAPPADVFAEFFAGSERAASTTMVMVRMLAKLLRDPRIGKFIVPIVPDEARTFGMDGLFPQAGIYSPDGQRYTPVDAGTLAPYREAKDGQILQEGICETGAMASFLAAGIAYANHSLPMIPFYIFYSMFGFQRVGDMIWACGDSMAKGFLLGGTSGRTTLNGEGVQHQDGHTQLMASTVPNLDSYDPAFAFELALIVRDGIRRMYDANEDVFYYLTITNQAYAQPAMPTGVEDGVIAGLYCFKRSTAGSPAADIGKQVKGRKGSRATDNKRASESDNAIDNAIKAHVFGSGAIMAEALQAATLLEDAGISTDVWSAPSYNCLVRDAQEVQRRNLLNPTQPAERCYVERALANETGVFIAASDYMKSVPGRIAQWIPGPFAVLGTDGFGLSEARPELRDYFEVSAAWIAYAAASLLVREGLITADRLTELRAGWRVPAKGMAH